MRQASRLFYLTLPCDMLAPDCFPHCDLHTIFEYLREMQRILKPGEGRSALEACLQPRCAGSGKLGRGVVNLSCRIKCPDGDWLLAGVPRQARAGWCTRQTYSRRPVSRDLRGRRLRVFKASVSLRLKPSASSWLRPVCRAMLLCCRHSRGYLYMSLCILAS